MKKISIKKEKKKLKRLKNGPSKVLYSKKLKY